MARDPKNELRAFVDAWRIASGKLEELRRQALQDVDLANHIKAMDGPFEATLAGPPRMTSGLVEQQAIFARMKNAGSVPPRG